MQTRTNRGYRDHSSPAWIECIGWRKLWYFNVPLTGAEDELIRTDELRAARSNDGGIYAGVTV